MVKVVDNLVHKRKRFNKNKKKAWRKKADISEVEAKLDDERREERLGGPLAERESNDLMFLDVGDDGINNGVTIKTDPDDKPIKLEFTLDKIPEQSKAKKKVELKESKKGVKPLKSQQFINGLQGAKMPVKPRMKEGKLTVAMKRKAKLQSKDPQVGKKALRMVNDFKSYKKKVQAHRKKNSKKAVNDDLWAEGADPVTMECRKRGLDESFIPGIAKFYSTRMSLRPVRVPKNRYVAPSSLASVQAPAPGQSYNPTYEDHQELMARGVRQEKRREKGKIWTKRNLTDFFPTKDKAPTEETWLKEMSEGLPQGEEEEEEDEEDMKVEDPVTVSCRPKTERKTKKQRKKEKRTKVAQVKRLQKKEDRIRSNAVFRLKSIKKELDDEESMMLQRRASRMARKRDLMSKPHRLGKFRYKAEDIAMQLGHELPDSLRKATNVVNLLEDRFKNYQRRNLIDVRPSRTNKTKFKKVMKRGHREALAEFEKDTDED